MKVLFVAESLSPSKNTGVASAAVSLARALSAQVDVELIAPTEVDENEETEHFLEGMTAHLFPQPAFLPRTVVPKMQDFLAETLPQFDLVHIHGIWRYPQWAAARTAQRLGIPYIISPHGMCEPFELSRKAWKKKFYFDLIEKKTFQRSAAIHAVTEAEREHCMKLQPYKKIEVIPHGVEIRSPLSLEVVDQNLPSAIASIPSQSPVLLFMGRLHPKKGLDLLIPAFAQVLKQHSAAYSVLAGPDMLGYGEVLLRLAQSFGIQERVIFAGMITGAQKQAMLQRADVFTLPSYSEGFSVAILEALAAAKPVVISRYCYFDQVADVGCGRVVDCEVSQLAQAFNEFLSLDSLARAEIGRRGQQLIERSYTWSVASEQMHQLYRSILMARSKTQVLVS